MLGLPSFGFVEIKSFGQSPEFALTGLKGFVGSLAFGDVGDDAGESDQFTRFISNLETAHVDRATFTIGPQDAVFQVNVGRISCQGLERLQNPLSIFSVDRFPPLFRVRIVILNPASPDTFIGRADVVNFPHIGGANPECIRNVLSQLMKFLITLPQGKFSDPAFLDFGLKCPVVQRNLRAIRIIALAIPRVSANAEPIITRPAVVATSIREIRLAASMTESGFARSCSSELLNWQ